MQPTLLMLALMAWNPERSVTVCVESRVPTLLAEKIASRIFGEIGVTLNWVRSRRGCPSGALILSVTDVTPSDLLPGALGYAQPYEGTHLRVFADRVASASDYPQRLCGRVLGHVFAHEIGHMLQGVIRHSTEGVMEGTWSASDKGAMRAKPLTFSELDVRLIQGGVDSRAAGAAATR